MQAELDVMLALRARQSLRFRVSNRLGMAVAKAKDSGRAEPRALIDISSWFLVLYVTCG